MKSRKLDKVDQQEFASIQGLTISDDHFQANENSAAGDVQSPLSVDTEASTDSPTSVEHFEASDVQTPLSVDSEASTEVDSPVSVGHSEADDIHTPLSVDTECSTEVDSPSPNESPRTPPPTPASQLESLPVDLAEIVAAVVDELVDKTVSDSESQSSFSSEEEELEEKSSPAAMMIDVRAAKKMNTSDKSTQYSPPPHIMLDWEIVNHSDAEIVAVDAYEQKYPDDALRDFEIMKPESSNELISGIREVVQRHKALDVTSVSLQAQAGFVNIEDIDKISRQPVQGAGFFGGFCNFFSSPKKGVPASQNQSPSADPARKSFCCY